MMYQWQVGEVMININALNYSYSANNPLYKNLNLNLESGHVCGLLGVNGAGKSTILKLLTGLLFPKSGEIDINQHMPSLREAEFLSDTFYLPEAFILPNLTVNKYIKYYASFYPKFNNALCEQLLSDFSVQDTASLNSLSHGQQKKFLIAFAFATEANTLLLDEPTNGLDIPSKQKFRKALTAHANPERTIIISSHQVKDIENLLDLIMIIDSGEILFKQTAQMIQEKLQISQMQELPKPCEYLFAEKNVNGYIVVHKNTRKKAAMLDLEILFNTVLNNHEAVNACF